MRALVWIAVLLGACGRIGFDQVGDGGSPSDGAASYVATVLADRPTVYYRVDEPSGTIAHDSSGNGIDGMYSSSGSGQITLAQAGALARDPDDGSGIPGGNRYDELALYDHALSAASIAAHDAAVAENRGGAHASNRGRRRLHI